MKKTIHITYIDTAGHGYYSVSKKDFLLVGGDPKKISGCSGMTYTRLYLEEDCDAALFFDPAKANGYTFVCKNSYNPRFNIVGYVARLFDYIPQIGHVLTLSDNGLYKITDIRPNGKLIVMHMVSRMKYGIGKHNPFQHITDWILTA